MSAKKRHQSLVDSLEIKNAVDYSIKHPLASVDFSFKEIESVSDKISKRILNEAKIDYLTHEHGIYKLVEYLGGRILLAKYKNIERNTIMIFPNEVTSGKFKSKFIIFLADDNTFYKDKFVVAHQLGHYFLHYFLSGRHKKETRIVMTEVYDTIPNVQTQGVPIIEKEANSFAAAFLMPESVVKECCSEMKLLESNSNDKHGAILQLSRKYHLESHVVERRLNDIGVIV